MIVINIINDEIRISFASAASSEKRSFVSKQPSRNIDRSLDTKRHKH
jgi:hypothetical protein